MLVNHYVTLGRSGLRVSLICLGTMTYGSPNWRDWVLGEEDSRPFIKKALESGINFFDTANGYGAGASETILGKLIAGSRDELVITTKVFFPTGADESQHHTRGCVCPIVINFE